MVFADTHRTANFPQEIQAGEIDPNGTLILITAKGLVCDFCAQALEKVFMKRAEVSGIDVNLSEKRIVISLRSGQNIDDDAIKKMILDAGYNLSKIERTTPDAVGVK